MGLARSDQQRQNLNLFESVALNAGGAHLYWGAFAQRDIAALTGPML